MLSTRLDDVRNEPISRFDLFAIFHLIHGNSVFIENKYMDVVTRMEQILGRTPVGEDGHKFVIYTLANFEHCIDCEYIEDFIKRVGAYLHVTNSYKLDLKGERLKKYMQDFSAKYDIDFVITPQMIESIHLNETACFVRSMLFYICTQVGMEKCKSIGFTIREISEMKSLTKQRFFIVFVQNVLLKYITANILFGLSRARAGPILRSMNITH